MTQYTTRKLKVRTEDHTLKVVHDPKAGGYEFTLSGWTNAYGGGTDTELVLEVETGWTDRSSGLPAVVMAEFDGVSVLDLVDQVLEWATKVRLMDEQLEAELAMEP